MIMAWKYFRFPFATMGDKTAVPDASQPDGTVSYEDGYGPFYALDQSSDPNALPIEREKFNQAMNDVTSVLQSLQQNSVPDFITSAENGGVPFSYAQGVRVRFNPGSGYAIYRSNVASNTTDPTNTTNWSLDSATTAATETVAGIAEIATNAETIAGTDDSRIVTPAKIRFGFAVSLTTNGYIAFPTWLGGIVIQWGSNATDGAGNSTITYPLTFPNNCFGLFAAINSINCTFRVVPTSTTIGNVYTFIPSTGGPFASASYRWFAIGN